MKHIHKDIQNNLLFSIGAFRMLDGLGLQLETSTKVEKSTIADSAWRQLSNTALILEDQL
jgi:hypothetical protein